MCVCVCVNGECGGNNDPVNVLQQKNTNKRELLSMSNTTILRPFKQKERENLMIVSEVFC